MSKIICNKRAFCSPPSCRCIVLSTDTPIDIGINLDNVIDIYDNEIDGLLLRVENLSADKVVEKLSTFIERLQEIIDNGEIHEHLEALKA